MTDFFDVSDKVRITQYPEHWAVGALGTVDATSNSSWGIRVRLDDLGQQLWCAAHELERAS